jgi:maltooligosyltrehalose trehalohydrolase
MVQVVLDPFGAAPERRAMTETADAMFAIECADVGPGTRYAFLLDAEGPFPDPASRFQPDGVHGASQVVDPSAFRWSDAGWRGIPLERAVVYEMHVGTFTPAGTFAGAAERLPYLAALGITAVELMPVADFPGSRNWGYDGASLFAPARCYGTPDDLRRFVDAAHRAGLAVLLDVVYNHFGPDGAYVAAFSPHYLSTRHTSPWGVAVNLDGERAGQVRGFFIENALHWLHEYHFDGLRLDATHALVDESPRHFLAELAVRVRATAGRPRLLVAEDDRNLPVLVRAGEEGGWGLDAVWADDFHHQVRVLTAGDRDGYYMDFSGTVEDLGATLRQGWFYRGQVSAYRGKPHGEDPGGVPLERMVICIQNHDQVGNRPFGRRLNQDIEPALYRAVSALLLCAPETPLLFMGQEWAADTPFLFFTDHAPELGGLITEGRRAEFARFDAYADASLRARIPDPQAPATFDASRLRWEEQSAPLHAGMLALYRALLAWRRDQPALSGHGRLDVRAVGESGLLLARESSAGPALVLIAWLRGAGECGAHCWPEWLAGRPASVLLTTEEPRFQEPGSTPAHAPVIDGTRQPRVIFQRPSAVLFAAD